MRRSHFRPTSGSIPRLKLFFQEEDEGELIPYVVTAKQTLAETLEDFLKEIKLFSEYKHYFH
ncbi:MAG: hypothetical protein J7619_29435 [Dyadobacter sp.]|uniref:hypothetical protein n=1 Tax=Dyadobacter sp. TaxID=1914288 RepID=UPI001B008D51|nr:hypothetical protein [Dyadobacter sp.]MBO9616845.1 hypothetical protein [Dyadobacter sp.]